MPTTTRYGWPYPSLSDAPNGPTAVQSLATAVDAAAFPGTAMGLPRTTTADGTPTPGTTVETRDAVLGSYVFTALAGHRYRAVIDGLVLSGDTIADLYTVNLRNGGASTPTSASTLVASTNVYIVQTGVIGRIAAVVSHSFAPAAGTVTLGLFLHRIGGTGAATPVSPFDGAGRELYAVDLGLA